jgi:hypothetical protein
MSRKVKPLSLRLINQLQVIFSAMEFGDHDASLKAWQLGEELWEQVRAEIVQNIAERHQDEVATIKALMPGKGSRK